MNLKPKLCIVYIKGTDNNTLITVTDVTGATIIYKSSGGCNTKAGRLKNSTKIASVLFEHLNNVFTQLGVSLLIVKWRNLGAGYDSYMTLGVKVLLASLQRHYNVLKVINATPVIHGFRRIQKPKHK